LGTGCEEPGNRFAAYEEKTTVPRFETDSFEFALPDGCRVDELPDAARGAFAFGEYTSKIESDGATFKYRREYKIRTTSVPPENIEDLGKFFSEINQDERSMAVLKRAN
jgi:hypothetical protein